MKNIFIRIVAICLACILVSLNHYALAQDSDISEIVIKGNQRVENETIISYMDVNIGDSFDVDNLNRNVKNIFSSGFFSDVKISRQGSKLIIKVIENPIVNRVFFEGNKKINDEDLNSEIQISPRSVFTRAKIHDEVERIITIYRRNGRFDAKVTPKVVTLPQNRVDIVFEINEGENTEILSINFIGNKNFSDRRLRDIIITRQTRWYSILTSTDRYDPDQLSADRDELRRFYINHGFADFLVESSVAQLSKKKDGFNIIFSITEGRKYNINNVVIENLVDGVITKDLLKELSVQPGKTYSANQIEESINVLTDIIIAQGYPFINIVPEVQRVKNENFINVNFKVYSSDKVYVSRINIIGNDRTIDEVIRRNIRLAEGDAIVPKLISRSQSLIVNLGFFENVEIKELSTGKHGYSDLNVSIVEKATGELSFGGGYSTTAGGVVQFGIKENNFLGKGQKLNFNARLSGRQQTVSAGFTEPYFYQREVSLGGNIYDDEYDYRESNYILDKKGFNINSYFSLSEFLKQGLSYTLETRDVQPDSSASASIVAEKGETVLSKISTSLNYNTIDNFLNPSEGLKSGTSAAFAGIGGDKKYISFSNNTQYFYPYNDKQIIFGLSIDSGITLGLDEDILISDRFFLGGTKFRGFAPAGVGPRDKSNKDSLGGNYYYVGTAKATFGLGLPPELGVKGTIFSIIGSISGIDKASVAYHDDFSPRLSTGVGISWQSPFGPISLSFTQAIVKESYDQTEVFNFGMGTSF